ncbi:MAG: RDD family protein [Candidatus Peribacter sp.]|nr:RDD family protein [Candidatus Peribacter sp.]
MYCKKCGKALHERASFCKHCGAEVPTALKREKVFADDYDRYAGFWPRFGAYITDLSILFTATAIVLLMIENQDYDWIFWPIFIAYHTYFVYRKSATPGKILFGLKVVNSEGTETSFNQALGRAFAYLVSGAIFCIGFFNIAFDSKHRGWHDVIAHTYVLQKNKWNRALAILLSIVLFVLCMVVLINTPSSNETNSQPIDYSNTENANNSNTIPRPNIQYDTNYIAQNDSPRTKEVTGFQQQTNSDLIGKFDIRRNLHAVVSILCKTSDEEWVHGSGIIFSENGLILTNYHVIENAMQNLCVIGFTTDISKDPTYMYIADADFRQDDETLKQYHDEDLDVAVMKIVAPLEEGDSLPDSFPYISNFGTSDALGINDKIYVVGYPQYGAGTITSTEGVVSGRVGSTYIKTSAKIDAGNSGGAAFNERGEYIGIPTFIISGIDDALGYIVGFDAIDYWFGSQME